MKLSSISNIYNNRVYGDLTTVSNPQKNSFEKKTYADYNAENVRAAHLPLSFRGNAPEITKAYIITKEEDIELQDTRLNESYIVDFDSQTELIYGSQAIRFLKDREHFDFDTQVIFPKKAEGTLIVDGQEIPLGENIGVMINRNSDVKFDVKKGYPFVVLSKKDYDWYSRYGLDSGDINIRHKFEELMYYNANLYNSEFSPSIFLPAKLTDEKFLNSIGLSKYQSRNYLINDLLNKYWMLSEQDKNMVAFVKSIVEKLIDKKMLVRKEDGSVKIPADKMFNRDYLKKYLKEDGFTDEEIKIISPVFSMIRQIKTSSKLSLRNPAEDIPQELIHKLEDSNLIFKNKKNPEKYMYWKKCYNSENHLRTELEKAGFSYDEQNLIISNWHKSNLIGFDLTGLKFINGDVAVYDFNEKRNNWTLDATNWVTNSTAISSVDGKTPFIGVSLVQRDKKGPASIHEIRQGEKLHIHPNREDRRQTEVYLVTSGMAALNIVKNGKTQIKIIKEGELAVIDPGVAHCVNSVLGEYEQICVQVPSAFQYGFGFKADADIPDDYDEERLTQQAFIELQK